MNEDAAMETQELRNALPGGHLKLPGIKLTVIEGPDRGLDVVGRRGVLRVGTSTDNDLCLRDGAVSRRHFEVRLRAGEVRVADLDSTNGTFIDGVRIIEAILSPGSLIKLGETRIRVSPVTEPVIVPLSKADHFGGLLGTSPAMRQVFAILERAAPTEATILIQGETGTGKEVAAEAIHAKSSRVDGPFIAVDCGAIAPTLVESELFGHVKGAFTGAVADRKGAFEEANGGTLFLDELGELPLDLQPKLLRALETRQIKRVGATITNKVNVRVLAATNRDLAAEINRGTFREDLFFRLAVVQVSLPPLRARREDIPTIVRHFVRRFAPDAPPPSPSTIQALQSQPWPGNVRELRNAVERALALASPELDPATTTAEHQGALLELMTPLFSRPIKEAIEQWTERFERAYLEHALMRNGHSVSETARQIGVNRRYVQRMMKRLSMREDE